MSGRYDGKPFLRLLECYVLSSVELWWSSARRCLALKQLPMNPLMP